LDEGLRALVTHYGVEAPRKSGILLVDDERPNLMVLRGFLDGAYQVYEAESGKQALELADKADLDVVITDQRMPEMTGVEMLEELRSRKPDVAGIVLTGFTDPPALISAINRARVFRFLKKPWQPEDILEAVRQACEHASADLLESVHIGTQGIANLLETLEATHQFASAGAIHLALERVAPAQVVHGAIAISRMDLNFRARKVEVQVQDDLPYVNGDRQKLIQVLVNLVRNALQATERSRRILIQATRDADHVVLAVEDEGPGVPHELQEKIRSEERRVGK